MSDTEYKLSDEQIYRILSVERIKWAKGPPTYQLDRAAARAIEAATAAKYAERIAELQAKLDAAAVAEATAPLLARIAELNAIINTPQADDFLRATSTEAEHQRQRWGSDHDAGKTPADWFWLIGYLAGKALHAHIAGNAEKAEHHIITTAAAALNWHRAVFGKTGMRPGTDLDTKEASKT